MEVFAHNVLRFEPKAEPHHPVFWRDLAERTGLSKFARRRA
jgi:hypothetical protein